MQICFSTSDVHPRDRLDYWRDVACRAFVELDCRAAEPDFFATIRSGTLSQLGLSIVESAPCEVVRTAQDIKRSKADDILLSLQMSGSSILVQDGREAQLNPGEFALYDTRRSYALKVGGGTRQLVLKIPRTDLEAQLGPVSSFTAQKVSAAGPIGGLAAGYLSMLPSRIGSLDEAAERTVAEQVLGLLSLACAREIRHGQAPLTSARTAALLNLKSAIETRLADPAFGPSDAARAARLSVRYANALLASEGTSLERYIFSRRLERCRAILHDPNLGRRSIADIAYSHGFSSASHFSRRFKEKYGATPAEYRRKRS